MDRTARILLVEDEEHIAEGITINLEMEGYEVVLAKTGKQAIDFFKSQRFNILVLDIMLPELDGYQVCEQIRLVNNQIPILFLTAKGNISDKLQGLKKGADDYMTKPFNLEEFLLRVKNLVKRSYNTAQASPITLFKFGYNQVNFTTYEAIGVNGPFRLSKRESLLLKLLIERKNEVVSREEILSNVWGYDVYPSTRTIDNFIVSFRKKFEKNPKKPHFFHSIRGVGYKFVC